MSRTEIRLAGFGGQGILLAGHILAKAMAIYEGREVVQTASYGSEARGGECKSDIIVSDEEIDYPEISKTDAMIIMSQQAFDKYVNQLKSGGVLIIDSTFVKKFEMGEKIYVVPATQIASFEFNRSMVANMIMLGALVNATGIVSKDAVKASLKESVPKGTEELNLRAFERGTQVTDRQKP